MHEWSKRVIPIPLMSNGCVLDVTCNKPINLKSHLPFPLKASCARQFGNTT